jgi:hypothetical protein
MQEYSRQYIFISSLNFTFVLDRSFKFFKYQIGPLNFLMMQEQFNVTTTDKILNISFIFRFFLVQLLDLNLS